MIDNLNIRKSLSPFKRTPLHPQWFVFKGEQRALWDIGGQTRGVVLDIGAGAQNVEKALPLECQYLSLDYYKTVDQLYHTTPRIFGDGQELPIKSGTVDTVLLLNVLEHIPIVEKCVSEVWRVLRPGGRSILQVPFLYPLHDVPYDYNRWTRYGLQSLAVRAGFIVESEKSFGNPLESAALILNLALSKTVLNWIKGRSPLMIFAPLFLTLIPGLNICAWLLSPVCAKDDFMPYSYRSVWIKPL